MNRDILISGASVSGPALAWWLARRGFRPVIVERSGQLRGGGYAVDFRGEVHLSVLERMGLLEQVRVRQTDLGGISYVDADGRPVASMPPVFFAGDVEILRGDLAAILNDATRDDTEYIFGDSVIGMEQDDDGVHVTFARATPRTFALVIGADGVHSNVRRLAFGPEERFARDLGLYTSSFTAPGLRYDPDDTGQQREIIIRQFGELGWQVPRLLAEMPAAADFYFDTTSQIRMDTWSHGRVALIGDAGYAAGPGRAEAGGRQPGLPRPANPEEDPATQPVLQDPALPAGQGTDQPRRHQDRHLDHPSRLRSGSRLTARTSPERPLQRYFCSAGR